MATTTLDPPAARVTRTPRQQWDAALQEHRSAQAAADAICGECQRSAEPLSKPIEDERERLVNLADDLHSALLRVPAPDGEALLFKLEYLLQLGDTDSLECWTGMLVTPAVEDARRLLAPPSPDARRDALSRLETVASFIRRLIGSASEDLITIVESAPAGSNIAQCGNDAIETLSIALEYVDQVNPLIDSAYVAQHSRGE